MNSGSFSHLCVACPHCSWNSRKCPVFYSFVASSSWKDLRKTASWWANPWTPSQLRPGAQQVRIENWNESCHLRKLRQGSRQTDLSRPRLHYWKSKGPSLSAGWRLHAFRGSSHHDVTAIYCGFTGSTVGRFQYQGILFLQVEWSSQAGPMPTFWLGAIVPTPHDQTYLNSGRVKRRGRGCSFRQVSSCSRGLDGHSGGGGMLRFLLARIGAGSFQSWRTHWPSSLC